MKLLALLSLSLSILSFSQDNVNSKYLVESVQFDKRIDKRLSRSLRQEVEQLVGNHFDAKAVGELAARIGKEIHNKVTSRIEKGEKADHVRVIFGSDRRSRLQADASLNKLQYHSQLGTSFGLEAASDFGRNRIGVGFRSDAENNLERQIGWTLRVARDLGERVRLKMDFDALRQKWNTATQLALASRPDIPGIYRERYSVEPAIQFIVSNGVTFTTGVSIQHFETQFPAARFEASNAWTNTLRVRRRWDSDISSTGQELDAGYNLRAATRALDSDFAYVRHLAWATYRAHVGDEHFVISVYGGQLNGSAPLFERFTMGNSTTLRGWNRFDVAPLGGDRAAHSSVQYRHKHVGVFYDAGAVWERKRATVVRHSAGILLAKSRRQGSPYFGVAFPIRDGGVTPVWLLGTNF